MSYLFPLGDAAGLGVLQVGSNISVDANSIISIPQSVATTANVTFEIISANSNINVGGNITVINNITALGNISGTTLLDSNNRVVTKVTPTAGNAISISSLTSNGPNVAFTITNTGVTSIVAGNNISISSATGAVTINASQSPLISTVGANANYTALVTDEYIGVTANPTTITLPIGIVGKTYIVKNEANTGTTTVTGTSSEKLDGSNNKTLTSNASLTVVFRSGAWRII